jgi:hypothetical protein
VHVSQATPPKNQQPTEHHKQNEGEVKDDDEIGEHAQAEA